MEREPQAHLTKDEIHQLLLSDTGSKDRTSAKQRRALELHVSSCELCGSLVEIHRAELSRLAGLTVNRAAIRGELCPDEDVWMEMAASLLGPDLASRYAQHAVSCDYCGQMLRNAVRDLTLPVSGEEKQFFTNSAVLQPAWQANLLEKMITSSGSEQKASPGYPAAAVRRPLYWIGAAAILIVAASVGFWWNTHRDRSPEGLLNEAYVEKRTLDLRIGNTRHSILQVRRGPSANSSLDRPKSLIEAEALIVRGLAKTPHDPVWLEAKGRADLLAWNYESALHTLKQALEVQPDSPGFLTDLASAYFERAEATGRDIDYGTAFDLLSQALKVRPDDPVVLFNRAVISERMKLFDQAIDDWEHYLKIDPDGGWAKEARERLESIRKKKVGTNQAYPSS